MPGTAEGSPWPAGRAGHGEASRVDGSACWLTAATLRRRGSSSQRRKSRTLWLNGAIVRRASATTELEEAHVLSAATQDLADVEPRVSIFLNAVILAIREIEVAWDREKVCRDERASLG